MNCMRALDMQKRFKNTEDILVCCHEKYLNSVFKLNRHAAIVIYLDYLFEHCTTVYTQKAFILKKRPVAEISLYSTFCQFIGFAPI